MQLAAVLAFVFSRNLWLNVASTCFSTRGWPIQFSDARRHLFTRDDAAKGAVLDSLIFAPQPGATQSFELTLLHSIGASVARVFEGLALQGACRRTAKARPMSQLCPNTSKYNILQNKATQVLPCSKTIQRPQMLPDLVQDCCIGDAWSRAPFFIKALLK